MTAKDTTSVKDTMKFELEDISKPNGKAMAIKTANLLKTHTLLWLIVKRHKVGLLAIGNIVLVLNWAFPEWVQVLQSLR